MVEAAVETTPSKILPNVFMLFSIPQNLSALPQEELTILE